MPHVTNNPAFMSAAALDAGADAELVPDPPPRCEDCGDDLVGGRHRCMECGRLVCNWCAGHVHYGGCRDRK